jgi:hypothetical protein
LTSLLTVGNTGCVSNRKRRQQLRTALQLGSTSAQNLNIARSVESCSFWMGWAMLGQSRLPTEESEELPRELLDLGQRIAELPALQRRDLETVYAQVVDSVRRRRRILSLVQEALSQLRLDIKYLMFDLEVTRKERDALRHQMGEP